MGPAVAAAAASNKPWRAWPVFWHLALRTVSADTASKPNSRADGELISYSGQTHSERGDRMLAEDT